jgi:hypothetical protein
VDDPDRGTARLACTWAAFGYENDGDVVAARSIAERALTLCDEDEGPWMRALLTAQVGDFAFQSGDFAAARTYMLEARPLLVALGAEEDGAQLRANLALLAVHAGDFYEA